MISPALIFAVQNISQLKSSGINYVTCPDNVPRKLKLFGSFMFF